MPSSNWCNIHRVNYPCDEMCRACLTEFVGELKDKIKEVIREEEGRFRCSIVSELRQTAPQTTSVRSANESSESSNTTKPLKTSTKNQNFVRIVEKDQWGILLRTNLKSVWWGWHHSPEYQRWCLNIIPFLTIWWMKPGGKKP